VYGKKLLGAWLLWSLCGLVLWGQPATINGTVTDAESGEALFGATVFLPAAGTGTTTNPYGFFAVSADRSETTTLVVSMLGYGTDTLRVAPSAGATGLQIALLPLGEELTTVEVTARPAEGSITPTPGLVRLSLEQVEQMPVLLGEKDAFKALQLQAGVSNPREGFGGLFVRGGSPDQNLILLDGATVYNAFHLFGFLSVFNADALNSVDLYKGGFPARYGGRVASVIDVRMKEGNRKKWSGSGGIGLITSRLTLEGPLDKKGKTSILLSGRRTYFDLLLNLLTPPEERNILNFGDLNAKINLELSDKDRLYVSAYTGRDNFGSAFTSDNRSTRDAFNWGNRTLTARYNRKLGDRAFLNVTAIGSGFDFRVENQETIRDTAFSLTYTSTINDLGLQADLDWFLDNRHTLRLGTSALRHDFNLGTVARQAGEAPALEGGQNLVAGEYALYLEDEFTPNAHLTINGGLRLTHFQPQQGEKTYQSLEPRLNVSYGLSPVVRLKGGINFTQQYLHLLSNSGPGLPTSLWVPASGRIPPQRGWQYALGATFLPRESRWAFNTEVYFRTVQDLIGYDNGATFLLLDVFESPEEADRIDILDNVTTGNGRAYGAEFSAQYRSSKLDFNLAYTLARVDHRLRNVNDFAYFPATQDRRHDLNFNGSWRFHPRLTLSFAWTYGSGVPVSLPRGVVRPPSLPGDPNANRELLLYGNRNNFRLPAIHRLDAGLRWRRSPKWGEAYWELGVYNAYARANPFFLFNSTNDQGEEAIFQAALFPLVPSLSYSFKF
jgi:outer membrane receptor for ferrienterochelin and colicin